MTTDPTPLSEKQMLAKDLYLPYIQPDLENEYTLFKYKDVRDAVRRLIDKTENERWDYDDKYISVDIQRSRVVEWIEEIFGKELCEDNSQDISNTLSRGVEEGSETHISSSNPDTRKGLLFNTQENKHYNPKKKGVKKK